MKHLLAALLLLGGLGGAQGAPVRSGYPMAATNGVVTILGRPVMSLRTSLAGVPAEQRAEIVVERLQEQLGQGANPRAIRVVKAPQEAQVLFGEALLFVVTPEEALLQYSTPESLAELWAHRLRALLAVPPLVASAGRIVVPLGESRSIRFGGLLRSPLLNSGGGEVAAVSLDSARGVAVVRGLKAGDVRVEFSREGAVLPIEVAVRPYAGRFTRGGVAYVTGNPAPSSLVRRMALAAAQAAVTLEPGAWVRLGTPSWRQGLSAGHRTRLSVPARIAGPGCLPVSAQIPVTVSNQRLAQAPAPQLFYSNDPERVSGYGTLFLGRLDSGRPARLLYHHENLMGRRFAVTVDVVNPSASPVRIHVTEGDAPPVSDAMQAGHAAARQFLRNQRGGIGYIAVLPPRSMLSVAEHTLRPGQVASGLFGIRQLDGREGCFVQVKADDDQAPFVRPADGSQPLSATVFGSAIKPVSAAYAVGGMWAFVRLGSGSGAGGRLSEESFGDYGVTYDIALSLSNPTSLPQKIGLVFEAASGTARGLFVVDGKLVETQALGAHEELLLASYVLPPGSERSVRVTTLPLSGSSYPARLVVRDLPRQAAIRPGALLRPQ